MKEKLLLSIIEKNYADGKKDKCIKHMNQYFIKHYNLEKLLLSGVKYEFYLENVKCLADAIQGSYTEEEIAVFAEFGLNNFIQKLLDNNWGEINKSILLCYVPSLINYDNLKGIPYNMLYDLYDKENNNDILLRFNENIDLIHALKLYQKKKENINFNIKCILLMKFYESDDYITYYNELSDNDKELFINNLILKNNDSKSLERAYRLFLLNNKRSLYDHIKTYDTGMYTYYLLKECKNLSKDNVNELTEKLEKCEDTQYRMFYIAYSYICNPNKLATQIFNSSIGILLFFDGLVLDPKCTNKNELNNLKGLYKEELEHDKIILAQKLSSIKINDGFYYPKYVENTENINAIYSSIQKRKNSKK